MLGFEAKGCVPLHFLNLSQLAAVFGLGISQIGTSEGPVGSRAQWMAPACSALDRRITQRLHTPGA